MKTLMKLVGSMALFASLPGDTLAQMPSGMGGASHAKPAVIQYPRNIHHAPEDGIVLGGGGSQGAEQGVLTFHPLLPQPTGDLSDDVVLVPGAPFVVFLGSSASEPLVLLDAGLVPDAGLRVLTLEMLMERGDELSVYFQSGDVIICLAGRDAVSRIDRDDAIALAGPGAAAASGQGAELMVGELSHGMSGQAAVSGSRGGSGLGDRGRRGGGSDPGPLGGASPSAQKQGAP